MMMKRKSKGGKKIRFHYFMFKEGRPTALDLAEADCVKK